MRGKLIEQQYRQGDVLITRKKIPASAVLKDDSRFTLAEGEAAGHAHTIERPVGKAQLLLDGTEMYLRVTSPVELQHQEHAAITIEPGEYMVIRKMETWLDEVREVMD